MSSSTLYRSAPAIKTTCNHAHLLKLTSTILQTHQTHASAIINGLLPKSVSICGSLILRYASYKYPLTSRRLFEQTFSFSRSAFLWNTLIRSFSIAGFHDHFETYNRMVQVFVRPDGHTFPSVLKTCADYFEFKKGLEVHGVVFKTGFDGDVFVCNTLMQFYGNCGSVRNASKVFDEMRERDIVSWNTVIGVFSVNRFYFEALELFSGMTLKANDVTLIIVLPACGECGDQLTAMQLHCYIVKAGLDSKVTLANTLIGMYGKCGNIEDSRQAFDEIVEKNDVSWNSIISSLSSMGSHKDALTTFRFMVDGGIMKPNSITISSMLPVLVELECFTLGKEIHSFCLRNNIETDIFVGNSLIDMYSKSGSSIHASNVFDSMDERNVVSWNAMVANLSQNGRELAAIKLIRQMQALGEIPNSITFTNVLPACARLGFLRPGKEIHGKAFRMGISTDLYVSNGLTDMYAKCGRLNLARAVFEISSRDEVSYNILIVGYSRTVECSESLTLFSKMACIGMKHDIVSFGGAISACANLSATRQGKEIHGFLVRNHFHSHLFIANSLLDFYTKCSRIDLAQKIFDGIPDKDVASWNTMILGYGLLGQLETAVALFEELKEDDKVQYDSVSYIAILSACSHGGHVDKGRKYFAEMKAEKIEAVHMHYACMVDLLGRAGLTEEAAQLIRSLPVKGDASIWGALLGACRLHGNLELALGAAEKLLELKPTHSGYYVLVANMYAEAGKWDEVSRIRELMKSNGSRKNPASSWVQIQDEVVAG